MKILIRLTFILLVGLAFAQVPPRPLPKNQVNDLAGVLDDSARTAALEYKLRKFTDSAQIEILAVTVRKIENQSSVDFAKELAKVWEDENEKKIGVFILIDVEDRDFAIVSGTAYASKLDHFVCRKIEDQFLKDFIKEEQYYEGFNAASIAVVNHITGRLSDKDLKSDSYHLYIFISLGVILVLLVSFYYLLKGIQANSFGSKPLGFSSAFMLMSHIHPSESSFENFEKGTGKFKTEDVSGSNLVSFGGGSWGSW